MNELVDLYTRRVGITHRKQLGQFFTPEKIAHFMVSWILESNPGTIMDPAFGLGVFGQEIHRQRPIVSIKGVEIDSEIGEFVRQTIGFPKINLRIEDYLRIWHKNIPAIICNPPYFRFQHLEDREYILNSFREYTGVKFSGYTNAASLFLLKSIYELAPNGRLAYIMPLEFLNTGYGRDVKEYMLQQGSIHAIIKIECEKYIFPEVTTTVCIIFFEKCGSKSDVCFYKIHEINHNSVIKPVFIKKISNKELKPEKKWGIYFQENIKVCSESLVPLKEYGFFSRGIATGANEFFIMNQTTRKQLGLLESECLPCITKSAQVEQGTFNERKFETLVKNDNLVFLLNINPKNPSSSALRYIEEGENQGFHLRYLTKTRNPWYKIERRTATPIWMGVFSRGDYKVLRNYSNVLNLTCFHGFQPNLFGLPFIDHLFLYFMSLTGRKIIKLNKRVYGEQLDKFEPGDLNEILVPNPNFFESIPNDFIEQEMEGIETTGILSRDADNLFVNLITK